MTTTDTRARQPAQGAMMAPIMTSNDVALLLNCKPGTIDEYARERKLPATKIGGSWVFTLDTLLPAINRMIEANVRPKPKAIKVRVRPDLSFYPIREVGSKARLSPETRVSFEVIDELSESVRGAGGFGHSGRF